jgi:hypothetical protein
MQTNASKICYKPIVLLLAGSVFATGCPAQTPQPGVIVVQESTDIGLPINSVLISDTAMAILDLPGVSGIAASECSSTSRSGVLTTSDCVVIYVSIGGIAAQLPTEIEGYPVVIRDGGPAGTNLR